MKNFRFNLKLQEPLKSINQDGVIILHYNDDTYLIILEFSNFNHIDSNNKLTSILITIINNNTNETLKTQIESTNLFDIKKNTFHYSMTINDTINLFNFNKEKKRIIWSSNNDNSSSLYLDDVYPWSGGIINGFFLWQGNFVNNSQNDIYYYTNVSSPQIDYNSNSNLVSGSGAYVYNDDIPENMNSIFLFNGYSNAYDALNNLTNYTTQNNMLTKAQTYLQQFIDNKQPYLLSLVLGGGLATTGGWDTGSSGAVYSIYEACTKEGMSFSYTESETGNTLSGTGTGKLNFIFNSLCFDIETWGNNSSSGSSGQDFLNLFNYIKNNENSTYFTYEMIIVVTMAHSCSNFNGTGQSVLSTIYSDKNNYYDYICPQMYTQNVGTTNEYAANYNILWNDNYEGDYNSFQYYLSQNSNYTIYDTKMILPAINFQNLYGGPGTNTTKNPNLYFYQSSDNNINPPANLPSGYIPIEYTVDEGVKSFFNTIMNSNNNEDIGGNIQWVNGNLTNN